MGAPQTAEYMDGVSFLAFDWNFNCCVGHLTFVIFSLIKPTWSNDVPMWHPIATKPSVKAGRMAELEQKQADHSEITVLTSEIVGAYVSHHTVAANDLPTLIATVGRELAGLGQELTEPEDEKPKPAVPIKRSVTPDHIICLEDGKKLKMMKRHLKTRYDMTPDEYRRRWGLKDDYPMVAPSYAATRSALAKKIGLGRKPEPAKPVKAPRKRAAKKTTAKKR